MLAGSYNQIMLKSPVLLESELDAVRNDSALNAKTFSLHYTAGTPHAMADALNELCKQVGRRRGRWMGDGRVQAPAAASNARQVLFRLPTLLLLRHCFPVRPTNLLSPAPPCLAPRWRPLCALGAAWSC